MTVKEAIDKCVSNGDFEIATYLRELLRLKEIVKQHNRTICLLRDNQKDYYLNNDYEGD